MVDHNMVQQDRMYSFAYVNDLFSLILDPMENGLSYVVPGLLLTWELGNLMSPSAVTNLIISQSLSLRLSPGLLHS